MTGLVVLPVLLAGWALLSGGLVLRRRTRPETADAPREDRRGAAVGSGAAAATGRAATATARTAARGGATVLPAIVAGWILLALSMAVRSRARRER